MPKIEVSPEVLRLLKIQSALSGQKMQDLASDILKAGLSSDVKVLSEKWNLKPQEEEVNEPFLVKEDESTFEQEEEKEPIDKEESLSVDDKETTLRLLYKLKALLEEKGKCTNRDLVLDEPEISKSGLYLHSFGIEQNSSRFYTKDQIPLIEDAIKELVNASG